MLGRGVRKWRFFFFRMCLSLYDCWSNTSRYSNGLTFLKKRVTTNQNHTIGSQRPKIRDSSITQKNTIKPQKEKEKEKERNKEEIQNQL